jgi:hypothetical protein
MAVRASNSVGVNSGAPLSRSTPAAATRIGPAKRENVRNCQPPASRTMS